MNSFKRLILNKIISRLKEPQRLIQVLLGPRQVGKTTLAHQAISSLGLPHHFASADEPGLEPTAWIRVQWQRARQIVLQQGQALLVLDEVQKVAHWSSLIKQLWEEDLRTQCPVRVLLLGSSPWLLQRGLGDSLAGRFEIIPVGHWSFAEMKAAFHFTLEQYLYFGGYPGAAPLIKEESRWKTYITEALIETTLSRDILLMVRIDKPALLRRLFQLGCHYSGQILSYQKMLGQLQDVGNTTTLAHYLQILAGVGILTGLPKFAGEVIRQRAASPKLQVLNTALMTAQHHYSFLEAQQDREYWGRLVESAVGAHLLNSLMDKKDALFYWREKNKEVDFVLKYDNKRVAIEVKSGLAYEHLSGLSAFQQQFHPTQQWCIGLQGIPLEEFLSRHPAEFLLDKIH